MSPRTSSGATPTFGTYLLGLMDSAGYDNRHTFAQAARMSHVNIGKWIEGTQSPSIEGLRKIAPLLNVRLGDLMIRAGLATAAELGQAGAPPPALPPIVRDILTRLAPKSPLTERGKLILQRHLKRELETFDEMYAEVLVTPDPKRRA